MTLETSMHLKWPISWDITDITVQLDMILYRHIHDIYVYRYLCIYIPSDKHTKNDGKSPFFMGKLTN